MKKLYITILLILAAAVFGQGYYSSFLLDMPVNGLNTRSSGMGELTVLAPCGAGNAVFTPANLPKDAGIFASAGVNITKYVDRREMKLYDSFGNMVSWTAYTNDKNNYAVPNIFAGYRLGGEFSPAIAVGYATVYDGRFDYEQQLRNESDVVIGYDTWASDLTLSGPAVAANVNLSKYGRLGVGFTMLSGDAGAEIDYTDPQFPVATDVRDSVELKANIISVSAVATPIKRVEIGLRFSPAAEIDGWSRDLPQRLGLGVAFRPSGYVATQVAFEAELFGYSDIDGFEDDAWTYRFGIEHQLPDGTQLRAGAYHYKIPFSSPVPVTALTLGSGFDFWQLHVDFAGGYKMSKFESQPISDPGRDLEEDEIPIDRMRQTGLYGNIGISYNFDL